MRLAAPVMLLLLGLLGGLPHVAAGNVTLYAHVSDQLYDVPFNTQEPPVEFHLDVGSTTLGSIGCAPELPQGTLNLDQPAHILYGYVMPSLADYGDAEHQPRIHPERGFREDLRLDPAVPMVLHWYWSQGNPALHGSIVGTDAAPPVPEVVMRATMREGHAISVDDVAYNSGELVAVGETAPAVLAGPNSVGVETLEVDGRTVYHFAVAMEVERPVVPRATGFNLKVETFVRLPACPGPGSVMPSAVLLHSSPELRPRLDFGLLNGPALESLHVQWAGSDLVVSALLREPWGDYDLASADLWLEGPGLPRTQLERLPVVLTTHCHCYATDAPLARQFVFRNATLPRGTYDATVRAVTLDGTVHDWSTSFEQAAPAEAPGLPPVLLLAGLAAAGVALRRQ